MSPLEAARRLASERPARGGTQTQRHRRGRCYYCLGDGYGQPHESDCPWLSVPKIIAALSAAERVVDRAFRPDTDVPGRRGYVDELKALRAALKDDSPRN